MVNGGESCSSLDIETNRVIRSSLEKYQPICPSGSESANISTEDSACWYSTISESSNNDERYQTRKNTLYNFYLKSLEDTKVDRDTVGRYSEETMDGGPLVENSFSSNNYHQKDQNFSSDSNYRDHNDGFNYRENNGFFYQSNSLQRLSGSDYRNDKMRRRSYGFERSGPPMEEVYDFGSVRCNGNHSVIGSVRGNNTDNDDLDNHSRSSSVSRRSEPAHYYSSTGYSHNGIRSSTRYTHSDNDRNQAIVHRSKSLPRQTNRERNRYREELNPKTLPCRQMNRPQSHSSPTPPEPVSNEAIVEEERVNPDGTTSLIRRVVTATTTSAYTENEIPKIEVHISPATETIISPPISPFVDDPQLDSTHVEVITTSAFRSQNGYDDSGDAHAPRHTKDNDSSYSRHSGSSQFSYHKLSDNSRHMNSKDDNSNVYSRQFHDVTINGEIRKNRHINSTNEYDRFTDDYNSHTNFNGEYLRPPSVDYNRPPSADYGSRDQIRSIEQNDSYNTETTGITKTLIKQHQYQQQIQERLHQQITNHQNRQPPPMHVTERAQVRRNEKTLDTKEHGNENDVSLFDLMLYLKTNDNVLKSNAAGYIMHVAYKDDGAKRKIGELDIIPLLVKLLDHEDEDCHRNAAGALKNLSYGRFIADNKLAIYRCGGVQACVRLLYKTSWIEVREHVTGILYNLSSYDKLKLDILKRAAENVAMLIIIPLSGWEKEFAENGRKPGIISLSILLRNATGILRNLSSAGVESREKLRPIEGLIDALLWIVRSAISSDDRKDINHKIVENSTCCLRNLSYKMDEEIDRNVYIDAVRAPAQSNNSSGTPTNQCANQIPRAIKPTNEDEDSSKSKNNSKENKNKSKNYDFPSDATKTGCLGMKKKPFKKRIEGQSNIPPSKKPPAEQWTYFSPVDESKKTPLGIELLYQPDTTTIYINLLTNSTNPVTLEAAAAAIHNLCGGRWNWAALLRIHVRLQKGIPPMHDLLSVDQEHVVRSIAYTLRNLAIDQTNKWSIGRFAHNGLIQVLPVVKTYETEQKPSEHTICAILSTLQTIVYKDYWNSKYVKDNDGVCRLVALTREPPEEKKETKQLRTYPKRVAIEANRVLLYMWEFKECREAIKQELWSHNKAEDEEKAFKQRTLQHKNTTDSFADVEQDDPDNISPPDRDYRRFITADESDNKRIPREEHEMQDFGNGDIPSDEMCEDNPLIRRGSSVKKEKKKSGVGLFRNSDHEEKSKKTSSRAKGDSEKLMNGFDDDSSV